MSKKWRQDFWVKTGTCDECNTVIDEKSPSLISLEIIGRKDTDDYDRIYLCGKCKDSKYFVCSNCDNMFHIEHERFLDSIFNERDERLCEYCITHIRLSIENKSDFWLDEDHFDETKVSKIDNIWTFLGIEDDIDSFMEWNSSIFIEEAVLKFLKNHYGYKDRTHEYQYSLEFIKKQLVDYIVKNCNGKYKPLPINNDLNIYQKQDLEYLRDYNSYQMFEVLETEEAKRIIDIFLSEFISIFHAEYGNTHVYRSGSLNYPSYRLICSHFEEGDRKSIKNISHVMKRIETYLKKKWRDVDTYLELLDPDNVEIIVIKISLWKGFQGKHFLGMYQFFDKCKRTCMNSYYDIKRLRKRSRVKIGRKKVTKRI